jgi:hypothetical protein
VIVKDDVKEKMIRVQRFRVQRFRVQGSKVPGSAQPLARKAASLIEKETFKKRITNIEQGIMNVEVRILFRTEKRGLRNE